MLGFKEREIICERNYRIFEERKIEFNFSEVSLNQKQR